MELQSLREERTLCAVENLFIEHIHQGWCQPSFRYIAGSGDDNIIQVDYGRLHLKVAWESPVRRCGDFMHLGFISHDGNLNLQVADRQVLEHVMAGDICHGCNMCALYFHQDMRQELHRRSVTHVSYNVCGLVLVIIC